MILTRNQPSVLPFLFIRGSSFGVFSLVLFLGFHLYSLSNLVFFDRSEVQQTLLFLSDNNLFFLVFDLFFVSLPLMIFLGRRVFIRPLSTNQGLSLLGQFSAILCLTAVLFHLYVTKMIFTDGLGLYHYFGDAMLLFKTPLGFYVYGAFLMFLTFLLCRELWLFVVEWGLIVKRRSQQITGRLLGFFGVLLVAFEIFIMVYQGQIK